MSYLDWFVLSNRWIFSQKAILSAVWDLNNIREKKSENLKKTRTTPKCKPRLFGIWCVVLRDFRNRRKIEYWCTFHKNKYFRGIKLEYLKIGSTTPALNKWKIPADWAWQWFDLEKPYITLIYNDNMGVFYFSQKDEHFFEKKLDFLSAIPALNEWTIPWLSTYTVTFR